MTKAHCNWLSPGCASIWCCVTEPLYVACGFALYLNKRTWLEGWDLQLGLSRLGERRRAAKNIIGTLLVLVLAAPFMEPAQAQTAASSTTTSEQQQVIELLASPEFMPLQEDRAAVD